MKYRILWATAVAGLLIHLAGLTWDVYRNSGDTILTQGDNGLSLGSPGDLMIVIGMAIVAASIFGMAALWANDRQLGGTGRRAAIARGLALPAISIIVGGSAWLATNADEPAPEVVELVMEHLPDPTPVPVGASGDASLVGAAASTEDHVHTTTDAAAASGDPLAEGDAHSHGNEVPATAEQLLAAGNFALEVKAKTEKYADIRDAMAAGYVQITQDLPGIAAHFIRPDYQHDGHELDPDYPETLLYTKRLDGQWRLVGVMFLAETVSDAPPSYFGPLDVWHRHENLCFVAGGRVSVTASAAECRGGLFVKQTAYQMHVWVVPGGTGVFAHDFAPISPGAFPGATLPAASELRVQAR
ncbi:MAG: hypothetical protein AB7J35_12260 [Dehalococcoidia bacterium]